MTFDEIAGHLSTSDQQVIKDMMILFEGIGEQTKEFARKTGLGCKAGCGACCSTPDIETTVAEVLPLSVQLWSQGLAQAMLDLIQARDAKGVCILYEAEAQDKTRGRCKAYAYRPGLCRLFGFSARHDKYSKPMLMTCKVIKEVQPQDCQRAQDNLEHGLKASLLTAHAFEVANIDPMNGNVLRPINQAIEIALKKVGYALRNV